MGPCVRRDDPLRVCAKLPRINARHDSAICYSPASEGPPSSVMAELLCRPAHEARTVEGTLLDQRLARPLDGHANVPLL
jgi:hypothetical protein